MSNVIIESLLISVQVVGDTLLENKDTFINCIEESLDRIDHIGCVFEKSHFVTLYLNAKVKSITLLYAQFPDIVNTGSGQRFVESLN
jgi:hypothetical protein